MSMGEPLFEETETRQGQEEFDFLAPERRQKFDLLIHLLANLDQPIFLSGPDGIGKSTILQQLLRRSLPGWQICLIQASGDSSFESLLQSLAKSLGMEPSSEPKLREKLGTMAGRDEMMILAIDDAGRLIPGVLDALCRFAFHCPSLRMVLALRPDDIHIKGMSDPWAVEEAHIIELPPLNEEQSQAYLQVVWSRMGKTIDPESPEAEGVYGHSHGIPANIRRYALERMGKPSIRWHRDLAKPIYLALALVLLAVVGVTWWQMQSVPEKMPASFDSKAHNVQDSGVLEPDMEILSTIEPVPIQGPDAVTLQEQASQFSALETNENSQQLEDLSEAPGAEAESPDSRSGSQQGEIENVPSSKLPQGPSEEVVQPDEMQEDVATAEPVAAEPTIEPEKPTAPEESLRDAAWLLQQPPLHYTLQIAAFEKLEDLRAFVSRHEQLEPLAFYHKQRNGRDWYPLLYGIYPSLGAVKEAKKRLPSDLGKPWMRRLRSVQKEISRAQTLQTE